MEKRTRRESILDGVAPAATEMLQLTVKINSKVQEIDTRLDELERCFPFLDDMEFYNERKSQLVELKKEMINNVKKLKEQYETLDV